MGRFIIKLTLITVSTYTDLLDWSTIRIVVFEWNIQSIELKLQHDTKMTVLPMIYFKTQL